MLQIDPELSLISRIAGLREAKTAEIFVLKSRIRDYETNIALLEVEIEALSAEVGKIDGALEVITAVNDANETYVDIVPDVDFDKADDFVPLDIDAAELPFPSRDADQKELISFILNLERRLAPTRSKRGISPKEVSDEIKRIFGRDVDKHKINGRLWYFFKKGEMKKRDKYYFLPTTKEAADAVETSAASYQSTPAETGDQ